VPVYALYSIKNLTSDYTKKNLKRQNSLAQGHKQTKKSVKQKNDGTMKEERRKESFFVLNLPG